MSGTRTAHDVAASVKDLLAIDDEISGGGFNGLVRQMFHLFGLSGSETTRRERYAVPAFLETMNADIRTGKLPPTPILVGGLLRIAERCSRSRKGDASFAIDLRISESALTTLGSALAEPIRYIDGAQVERELDQILRSHAFMGRQDLASLSAIALNGAARQRKIRISDFVGKHGGPLG